MIKPSRMTRRKEFRSVQTGRKCIKPFAGKYPTRWRLRILDSKRKVLFRYFGKPNKFVLLQFKRIAAKTNGYLTIDELDRGGLIREASAYAQGQPYFAIGYKAAIPCYMYYPWHVDTTDFFAAWAGPIYHKQFKRGNRTWFAYSPFQTMANDSSQQKLREYKTWISRSTGLWK